VEGWPVRAFANEFAALTAGAALQYVNINTAFPGETARFLREQKVK
jgi:hypothetical protein